MKADPTKLMMCLLLLGALNEGGFAQGEDAEAQSPAKSVNKVRLHFNHPQPVTSADEDKKQGSYRVDLSAAALSQDGKTLWTAADETVGTAPGIERLSLQEDGSFGAHESYPVTEFVNLPHMDKKEGRVPETDTEGLCLDNGYLWMVGSHSLNRKQANKGNEKKNLERLSTVDGGPNRFVLIRIPLASGAVDGGGELKVSQGTKTAALLDATEEKGLITKLLKDDTLKYFIPQKIKQDKGEGVPSKDNGLDIEGLAVAHGRIFLGLRGPVLRGWALVLEIAVKDTGKEGELKLKELGNGVPYARHFINLDGCGVRDLCMDGKDLLILSGPSMDLDGPACIYRWKGAVTSSLPSTDTLQEPDAEKFKKVLDLPVGYHADHPEGLALLPTSGPSGRKRVIVLYDSPKKARLPGEDDYQADVFELPEE